MAKKQILEGAAALSSEFSDDGGSEWPKVATLRNHGGISVIEPVTGAFLGAGGSHVIELQDQDHFDAVTASLEAVGQANGLSDKLAMDLA